MENLFIYASKYACMYVSLAYFSIFSFFSQFNI